MAELPGGRVHAAAELGGARVDAIATWPSGATLADVEEAVKAAARDAIRAARDRAQAAGVHR